MLRKVYLNGEMGEKFGRVAEVKAETVKDVMHYLDANYTGVKKYLLDSTEKDIGFTVRIADQYIDDDRELILPLDKGDIIITPTPVGSKGALKIIIGAIIVIYAWPLMAASSAGLFGSTLLAKIAVGVGLSLVMQGLMQLMAPDPSVDNDVEGMEEGYIFQGAEHSVAEGAPVPVLYGELRIPGQPISFNLENDYSGQTNYGQGNANRIGGLSDGQGNINKPIGMFVDPA